MLARKTERGREIESEKSLPREDGHTTIPSPPFSSLDLGHAHTHAWGEFQATRSRTRTAVDYVGVQRHSHYANYWLLVPVCLRSQEENGGEGTAA